MCGCVPTQGIGREKSTVAEEQAVVPTEDVTENTVNPEASAVAEPEKVGDKPEPQGTPEQGETEEQKSKRKGGWQRRIEKLERENEVLRELALARSEKEEKPADSKPKELAAPDPKDPMPDLDSFSGTLKEFNAELASWSIRQAKREFAAEQTAKEHASSQKTQEQKWNETQAAFADEHDDYEEASDAAVHVVRSLENSPGIQAISAATTDPELGPALLYELGKHPEEIKRLAAMSPTRAFLEIGKFSARLAGEKPAEKAETPEPPKTKAPKPLTPVTKPASTDKFDANDPKWAEKTNADEWARQRNAELAKQGRR